MPSARLSFAGIATLFAGALLPSAGALGQCFLSPLAHIGRSQTLHVAAQDNFAYTTASGRLNVYDISNPAAPVLVGSATLGSTAFDIAVSGNFAYIATFGSGFQIVDIADPANPAVINSFDTISPGGAVYKLDAVGNYVYAVVPNETFDVVLQVVDVSNPLDPVLAGTYSSDLQSISDVAVVGTTAFVSATYEGLKVIDVSNAFAPTLISSVDYVVDGENYQIGASATTAYIQGNAYNDEIGNYAPTLIAFDVSNPAAPSFIDTFGDVDSFIHMEVVGTRVYTARGNGGLSVFDISGSVVSEIGSVDTPGQAVSVAITGTNALIADTAQGMRVISIANPASPTEVGAAVEGTLPADPRGFAFSGSNLLVADGTNGLVILDIANPAIPSIRSTLNTPGEANAVVVSGTTAYIADGDAGLRIVSFANPAAPVSLGSIDTPGLAFGVAVVGTRVYIADGSSGLRIVDASNPAAPVSLGTIDTPYFAASVAAAGTNVVVADHEGGLRFIDASNPASPIAVADRDFSIETQMRSMLMAGSTVYGISRRDGIRIYNVSNFANPTLVGTYNHSPAWEAMSAAALSGSNVYVQTFEDFGGPGHQAAIDIIVAINVSNPASPIQQEAHAPLPYVAAALAATSDIVVAGTPLDGVFIFSTSTTPFIADGPDSLTTTAGSEANFRVSARSAAPLSFQWYKDGQPLMNSAHISGATSATLTIHDVTAADEGTYEVRVESACGPANPVSAVLTVGGTPACPADFNGDNTRDVADLFAYINAWLAKTPNADFNDDTAVDVADLFAYINAWLAGC